MQHVKEQKKHLRVFTFHSAPSHTPAAKYDTNIVKFSVNVFSCLSKAMRNIYITDTCNVCLKDKKLPFYV